MEQEPIDSLASELAARIESARGELLARMRALGLDPVDGWRVREEIRSTMSGTVVVLKPVHMRLDAPDIEATVQIGHDGHPVGR
jgi:hypothetical protein